MLCSDHAWSATWQYSNCILLLPLLVLLVLLAHPSSCCSFLLHYIDAAAQLPHQVRRRMTATAVSSATAIAKDGASVVADSKATSTGSPSVSVVNAEGSGDVNVVCKQQTGNNEALYKECIDKKSKEGKDSGVSTASTGNSTGSSSGTNTSAGGTTVPWDKAPRCTKPASAYKVVYDKAADGKRGNPWGWENNSTSCALR
jgi:hypothetical protein